MKEGLLAVSRKSDYVANKSNEDHSMEPDEQSEKELLHSEHEHNALPEQNHTISYNTQNSRQTKSSMKLMQET